MMTERDMAYGWAKQYHTDAVPLFHLSKGSQFVWPHEAKEKDFSQIKIYSGRGWYDINGRKCRSGTKTAVVFVDPVVVAA